MVSFRVPLLLFVLFTCAFSFDILIVAPWPSTSHFMSFSRLFEGLAERGHNVTVISYFPNKKGLPNYRDVVIDNLHIFKEKIDKVSSMKEMKTGKLFMYLSPMHVYQVGLFACEMMFQSIVVQNFLKADNNFDLILLHDFFSDCLLPLARKYGSPVIRYVPHMPAPWTGRKLGNPIGSAYMPNMHLPLNNRMSFFERLENAIVNSVQNSFHDLFIDNEQEKLSRKYYDNSEINIVKMSTNVSLVLLNTHFTLSYPRPLLPNMIEVGGIHIRQKQPLAENLEKWVNESTYGVIYFSFGSLVKAHTMPDEKRQAFINAFKRLPQRVIWKWENDTLEEKPDNVLIGKWLPQYDILSHPNVKAFISHGGLLGTIEAVHSGVPIMVIPQFGDQHTNAKAVESAGGGVILYMSEATEETIYQSLKKILEPSFQQQAKELSERFRDRPMPPLETAIYWVEYVARHKGAHFMKTAAVGMPFYQYYLLDVIAFIVVVLSIFSYLQYLLLRFVIRKIRGMFGKTVKQKKQ